MSIETAAAWLMAAPALALVAFMLSMPLWRYRVVWVRFSIAQSAVTRRGAHRIAERQRRKHDMEFRVRDVWCGRWVDAA